MTQRVYCEKCDTETDLTKEVFDFLERGHGEYPLALAEKEVDCCAEPELVWINTETVDGMSPSSETTTGEASQRNRKKTSPKEAFEEVVG